MIFYETNINIGGRCMMYSTQHRVYVVQGERKSHGDPSTAHKHAVFLQTNLVWICLSQSNPNPTLLFPK